MLTEKRKTQVIIGGGAAGFFAAIACAAENRLQSQERDVFLLEKSAQVLAKVRISGGGRCNVTHACFEPPLLVKNYPRGSKELLGPFNRFGPKDTIRWFEERGVLLKTEEDGRMFPVTDSSETIIHCLTQEAKKAGVVLQTQRGLHGIRRQDGRSSFILELADGEEMPCDQLLMATGGTPKMFPLLEKLGHTTVPLVPSLFTFNMPGSPFLDLAGVSVPLVSIKLCDWKELEVQGPLLFTHWGVSGPGVLKLSALAAPVLHSVNYKTTVAINWLPLLSEGEVQEQLQGHKKQSGSLLVGTESIFGLPKQLWKRLISIAGIGEECRMATLSHVQMKALIDQLRRTSLKLDGKTTYKQEFVTCGGIPLREVNCKTMESKLIPGLYFAGEILNVDGITGGFNFQNAWTTALIAGRAMSAAS